MVSNGSDVLSDGAQKEAEKVRVDGVRKSYLFVFM